MTAVGALTSDQVRAVLISATTAPSLYNSQPWRFRCTSTAIELCADDAQRLPVADPEGRELRIACGAALLNLRVAIAGCGVHPVVRMLPDPYRTELLATVRPQGRRQVTPEELALLAAMPRRHTNRRPFTSVPVPPRVLSELRRAAKSEHAWLARIVPSQVPLLRSLVRQAHAVQQKNPAYRAEWAAWMGTPPQPQDVEPNPLVVAVGSFHDLPLAQVQAGQAMQRVLLTATAEGLIASFLSQVVEVPTVRRQLRGLVGGGLWPQVVLRLGYGALTSSTPRRPLAEVVDDEVALA